jgi:hypothetical protein
VTSKPTRPVSDAETNRERQVLKWVFSLASNDGKLATPPPIGVLRDDNVRTGFLEPHHYQSVPTDPQAERRPIVTLTCVTGWRIASVLPPLEWRQVALEANEVARRGLHEEPRGSDLPSHRGTSNTPAGSAR